MKKLIVLVLAVIATSCNQAQENKISGDLLVRNINLINVNNGAVIPAQSIVIDSGRIKLISDVQLNAANFNESIDGTGKYVIPGLAEMHAHIPPATTSAERMEETLFLYLSNGITTIRGMLGAPIHLELREKVKSGETLGPRIFTSSPSMNGLTVTSEEEAIAKVKAYKKDGYDFLKIHPGIRRPVFDALAKTAHEVNIPFAGHVPVNVGIEHALKSNFATIDHIDGFLEGLVPESKNLNPADNGFFGYNFTQHADTTKIADLVALSKEHKVWIVPTQSLFERWFAPIPADTLLQQPEMKYMPTTTLNQWRDIKISTTGPESGFDTSQWEKFISIRKQLLKNLQDNGHGILLGSDAPQLYNVPGFSIHHEIAGMERAGLTPLEILQSGTINPARYLELTDEFGDLKEGLAADMVVLDANPLENLENLKQITAVIVQGKVIDKQAIDTKLASIADHAAQN